jgi:gas vesicle protein
MKQNIEMTAAMTRYFNLMGGTLNNEVNSAIENAKNEMMASAEKVKNEMMASVEKVKNEMMASVEKVKDSFWKNK